MTGIKGDGETTWGFVRDPEDRPCKDGHEGGTLTMESGNVVCKGCGAVLGAGGIAGQNNE